MTNIPKLTIKNTRETLKNVIPLPLKLTLNTFNTSIHCSIERRAGTTQINSTIYHSFFIMSAANHTSEYATKQNWQSIHDTHGIFSFSNSGITGFGIQNSKQNLN